MYGVGVHLEGKKIGKAFVSRTLGTMSIVSKCECGLKLPMKCILVM